MHVSPVRFWQGLIASLLVFVGTFTRAADPTPALESFQRLQTSLADDKKRADWKAFLADARAQQDFLNASPASILEVARAELQLGRQSAALTDIRRFLSMGQANPILSTPLFQPLSSTISPQVQINQSAVSRAMPVISISESGVLPEDIDYDASSERFFVTSILRHTIVALDNAGHQAIFAEAPDRWPMVALKIDEKRRRVWATEVAFNDFDDVPKAERGRSALLEFDANSGALLSRIEGPPHSALGDMVLAPNGDPIVSDGDGGGIYRLSGTSLVRIDHGDFISPQTVALCSDGRHAFVPDYVRGIGAFDLKDGTVRWLSTKGRFALDGVDGLYCHDAALIAVQNGTSPARVIVFHMNRTRTAIVSETLIERSTATLGIPTHGVIIGGAFYYIANSGWDGIDDHGALRDAGSSAVIMRTERI